MTSNKKYLLIIRTLEALYAPKVYKATYIYYSSFINDLQREGLGSAQSNLLTNVDTGEIQTILTNIYKTAGARGARLAYSDLKIIERTEKKAGGFGKNPKWIAEVLSYLRLNILEFAGNIIETVKQDILKIISKAVEDGLGVDDIVRLLRESPIPRARAKVIVRTEIVRAANVGHLAGAKDFPFEVNKKWVAARDARTRHSHISINGNQVDENDYFKVAVYKGKLLIGYEDMNAPGDPKASPQNTINCRCRITFVPKRDEQGKLIPRNAATARVIPIRSNNNLQSDTIRRAIAALIKMEV